MGGRQADGDCVTIPFLVDFEKSKRVKANDGTTSFLKTTFNGLNALSGVGILSVPYALSSGGWLSLILVFVIAIATFYTGLLIKRCMEVDPNIRSYPDIGDKAFGSKGRLVVSIFMNLELYLVATGFLIMAGDNLNNLLPNVQVKISGITVGGKQSFVLLVALVILATVFINSMAALSYVSATGVLASVVILGSVLWSGMFDGVGFHHKGELVNWRGLPTAFSLYAFCYCAHPVFPTLYTSMRNQRQFSSVLFVCFFICTVTYASTAVLGYLMFGSELQSQITLNLPTNKLTSKFAIYTALLNPIAKYALTLRPISDSAESYFKFHFGENKYRSFFTRSMLLGSSVVVALTLPFFVDLMSLVGAFLSVTASILLPCLCYLKISGESRNFGVESSIIRLVVLMGLVIFVFGTYTSLKQIMQNLR